MIEFMCISAVNLSACERVVVVASAIAVFEWDETS